MSEALLLLMMWVRLQAQERDDKVADKSEFTEFPWDEPPPCKTAEEDNLQSLPRLCRNERGETGNQRKSFRQRKEALALRQPVQLPTRSRVSGVKVA